MPLLTFKKGIDTGKWTTWADCQKLISEHDAEDDPLPEGLEAYGYDPCDGPDPPPYGGGDGGDEADDEDKEDGDGADGEAGGEDEGGAGGDGDSSGDSESDDASEDADDDISGDDAGDGSAAVAAESIDAPAEGGVAAHSFGAAKGDAPARASQEVSAAMQLLYQNAMAEKDDHMAKVLRKKIMTREIAEKESSTDVARALGKRVPE